MADPDFTFDTKTVPTRADLAPLYVAVLGPGATPTVSLGAVTRVIAVAWLAQAHRIYRDGLDQRSSLIKNMDLSQRVELVGLTDG